MSELWNTVQRFSQSKPDEIALIGQQKQYSWSQLKDEVVRVSQQLACFKNKVIALHEENSPAWVIIDIACQINQIILLPLPMFFSEQQLTHALKQAGASIILFNDSVKLKHGLENITNHKPIAGLKCVTVESAQSRLPEHTTKITFTSGSTGQPKGVCLSSPHQINVAQALLKAINLEGSKHLSILPFSTLLENIGGIYAPLLSGGTVIALPQQSLGFNGSTGFDLPVLTEAISHYSPQSIIVLPELLLALINAVRQGWQAPKSLQFIAVGGSKVSPELLAQAQSLGLPAYEGYGLSECASVLSLNTPESNKKGSIGKVLSHTTVSIEDNEIVVSENTFLGYVGDENSWHKNKVYTGDIGFFDDQNYLYIDGRKKNIIISSFGRNINPEWVESELLASGKLRHAVLFGDAKPFCVALVQAYEHTMQYDETQKVIDEVNAKLPRYAQIRRWAYVHQAMTFEAGLLTSNGRPIRDTIYQQYSQIIEHLYEGKA